MFNFELPSEQLERRRRKFVDDYDKFVAKCSLIDVLFVFVVIVRIFVFVYRVYTVNKSCIGGRGPILSFNSTNKLRPHAHQ